MLPLLSQGELSAVPQLSAEGEERWDLGAEGRSSEDLGDQLVQPLVDRQGDSS